MDAEFGSARPAIVSRSLRSHSIENAPPNAAGRPFPVLLFSHGFGESSLTYSAQLEDLASHGYVVFGIEHPFDAYALRLPGDRIVPFAKAKWDSALARPKGAVAYQLAQVPSPCTPPPTDASLVGMKLVRSQYDSITTFYQHNQDAALASMPGGAVRIMAEAEDFTHRTFIDLKLLQASDSNSVFHQTRYLQLIRQYTRAFFDETLRRQPAPLLDRQGPIDSVVTVDHFRKR